MGFRAPIPTQQAIDDQYSKDVSTRLTWQATQRNKVAMYLSYNNSCHCHFLVGRANAAIPVNSDASMLLHIPNKVVQGTWSSPITNRVLAEVGGSYILEDQQFNPRPESVAPQITDAIKNVTYRATTSSMRAYTPVYGSRGSLSYVTGSHAIKAGFTLVMGDYEQTSTRVGNMSFTANNGVPNVVTFAGTPTLAINRIRPNLGLYAQDQWTINRLTVNAGLRLDYFRSDYPDQNVAAHPVRAGAALLPGEGGGQLEGPEPALRRGLRSVRQRQDRRQGEREPLRPRRRHRPRQHDQSDPEQQHDGRASGSTRTTTASSRAIR